MGKKSKSKISRHQNRSSNPPTDASLSAFSNDLKKQNKELITIIPDGNCLFRCFSYSLTSSPHSQHEHQVYRTTIMNEIESHSSEYKFFIEDDEPFDQYIDRLRTDGEWGSGMEIMAACRLFNVRVLITQHDRPSYVMGEDGEESARLLEFSYHDGDHYNIVLPIEGLPLKTATTTTSAADGCPCGSGQSYRKCCRKEDRINSKGEGKGKGKGKSKGKSKGKPNKNKIKMSSVENSDLEVAFGKMILTV